MDKRRIIGLHGLPSAGKDTVADYLVERCGFTKLAFADKLKRELCTAFGCSPLLFTLESNKRNATKALSLSNCASFSFVCWYFDTAEGISELQGTHKALHAPRTPRWLMQRWGDYRKSDNPMYFIEPVQAIIDNVPSRNFVVSDVRSTDEAVTLLGYDCAEIWHIVRPGVTASDAHASNNKLSYEYISHVIRNDWDISELHKTISRLIAIDIPHVY